MNKMSTRKTTYRQRILVCCFTAAIVSGCETISPAEKMIAEGKVPLTADEVRTVFSGNSMYIKGSSWEYTGLLRQDSTSAGRAWGSWGEESYDGTWEVLDDGQLCMEDPGRVCRQYFPTDQADIYLGVLVSGSSKNKQFEAKISEGNTYGY